MSEKLTVLIPCKNESQHIGDCIASARLVADEILVADSLSTDDTLDIVQRVGGCRIIQREFIDYASFKNWAIPQATHSWVLILDADERVTESLAAEIRAVLQKNDLALDAYRMRREYFFLGKRIYHCGCNHTTIIRLFRRDACRYGPARVHEQFDVPADRVGSLQGKLLHYTCLSLTRFVEKQVQYAAIWAEDHHNAGRRVSLPGLLFRPIVRFLQLYIFRGGFLDGATGLVICYTNSFYTFLKYANLWEWNHVRRDRK